MSQNLIYNRNLKSIHKDLNFQNIYVVISDTTDS